MTGGAMAGGAGGPGGGAVAGRAGGSGDGEPDREQLLAHDIRSAMSDVIGGLRLVDRATLPAAALPQVDRAQAASELLARLVEELVGGAPRDAAGGNGGGGNLNLARFLDDELRRWHGAAAGTGARVRLDRAADVPEIVRIDLLHLRRVVANLMSNALRHAGGGRITLGARLEPDGALEICVCDDGPGFPADRLPDLGGGGARRVGGGSGMGLRIAAYHAEAIGGTIRARNRHRGGACVHLSVPRAVWRREAEAEAGLPDLAGVRVLVADDSATNRLLVERMLARLGAEVECAVDGIEALNWLARERFDLALLDLEMPSLGGLDVIRAERLRQARGIAPPMPMVAMTAYVLRDNRDAILEAGADGILAKPLGGIETFARSVRHYLDGAPDPAAWTPEAAPALSVATLTALMAAAGPDHERLLLDRLRDDLAMVAEALSRGAAAGDLEAVTAQTHVLLSLSGAIGALPTQEAARDLHRRLRAGEAAAVPDAARLCLDRLAALRRELAGAT